MLTKEVQIRVRYAETDQMGYVYYGNYATYYEVARVESLRNVGFSYKLMEEEGVMMPVVECKSKYIRPAKYDDLLTVRVTMDTLPTKRIVFKYEIFNEQKKLINVGETNLAFVNMKNGKSCEAPESVMMVLKPFFDDKT